MSPGTTAKTRSRSLTYEEDLENPLCLCEYYNRHNQRAHLLMCCCNCEALDGLCTSFLCCQCYGDGEEAYVAAPPVLPGASSSSMLTRLGRYLASRRRLFLETCRDVDDRLRIPFPGGARQVNWDFCFALLCILVYLRLGTLNFVCSVLTVMLVPVVLYARFFAARLAMSRRSHDHSAWVKDGAVGLREMSTQRQRLTTTARVAAADPPRIQIAYFVVLNALGLVFVAFNWSLGDELTPVLGTFERRLVSLLLLVAVAFHLYMHYSNPGFVDLARLRQLEQEKIDQELLSAAAAAASKQATGDSVTSKSPFAGRLHRNGIGSGGSDDDSNYCSKCELKRGHAFNLGHCPICKCCSFNRDHHCFWVDNCIGYLNHKQFVLYLLFLFAFFLYSLTRLFAHLRRQECALVGLSIFSGGSGESASPVAAAAAPPSCLFGVYYANFGRSLAVLLLMQLVPLVSYLFMLILQQFFFISLALTQHQIFKISQKNPRFSLALYISANLTLNSILRNWYLFCFRRRSTSDILNRQSQLVENLV